MTLVDGEWVVLYDVRQDGPGSELVFPVVGLLVVAIAIAAVRRRHFIRDDMGETRVVRGSRKARRVLAFAVLWFVLTLAMTLGPLFDLRHALDAHEYSVVEGSVEDYVPADILRKTPERWTVDGHRYALSDAESRNGFDRPGVVQGGMYVRIADVRGTIARLEASGSFPFGAGR